MKFHFRLDRLLHLRSREETERARELGEALVQEAEMRREVERAEEYLETCREQLSSKGSVRLAGMMHNLAEAVDVAVAHVDAARENHETSEDAVTLFREAFGKIRRDRRVLERFRERSEVTWERDVSRDEQSETDEVALEQWRHRGENQ